MNKKLVSGLICAGLATVPVAAQFGFPQIVFDPFALEQQVADAANFIEQLAQLQATYKQITNQYNQLIQNAKYITSKSKWKGVLSAWETPAGGSAYSSSLPWYKALKDGSGSVGGYTAATRRLNKYSNFDSLTSTQQDNIRADYATVEISDASTINSIAESGTIRGHGQANEDALTNLENDSLADGDDQNTEVAVLNKINAAAIIQSRTSQDTNKLLASVLDQQMIAEKARRDAMAQSINTDIAAQQLIPQYNAQHLGGAQATLTSYRMP